MDKIEEIKARIDIVSLVSEYVELKKAGRNFKGLSPFKNENTPSFVVSPDKEIAYCFATNQGGDIFDFYRLVENVTFPEAVEALASKAGVEIEKKSFDKKESEKNKKRKIEQKQIHDLAVKYYQDLMWDPKNEDGVKVLDYLRRRGLSDETIKKFKMGLSPDSYDQVGRFLLGKGFSKEEIVATGICYSKDTNFGKLVDRFRHRLMIPISDKRGEVIAFGGRALKKDDNPKYLNSPETDLYKKNKVLYGFDLAKDSIRKKEAVIVVEGYFDQMACFQAGFENVVAVSGVALTEEHLKMLKRFAKELVLCFDTDEAGQKAMVRSAELGYEHDFNVKVLKLSGGYKDPAESLQAEDGNFGGDLKKADSFFEYLVGREFEKGDANGLSMQDVKINIMNLLLPILSKVKSNIFVDTVLRNLSPKLKVNVASLYSDLEGFKADQKQRKKKVKVSEGVKDKRMLSREELLWSFLFYKPEVFSDIVSKFAEYAFIFEEKQVYKLFVHYYNDAALESIDIDLLKSIDGIYSKYSINLLELETKLPASFNVAVEVEKLFELLKKEYKKKRIAEIKWKLHEYPSHQFQSDEHQELLKEFNRVNNIK